jgi:hypothetical protein
MIQHFEEDTLHLLADYFLSQQDSLEDTLRIAAWPRVRIVMRNLQGSADSLEYNRKDSILYLYYNPVLWSDNNQMSGDTIVLTLKNETADSLHLYPKGFLISKEDTIGFNQVKGKQVFGKFESGALNRMRISGNAESIYFTRNEEKNTYEGMNQSLSNEILILFDENKPSISSGVIIFRLFFFTLVFNIRNETLLPRMKFVNKRKLTVLSSAVLASYYSEARLRQSSRRHPCVEKNRLFNTILQFYAD